MPETPQLGFPVPLLGMRPHRLPVLFDDGELLVLAKPQGVLVQPDAWNPRLPVLIEAIRHQAAQAKPEFVRCGIGTEGLWAVTDLDPELYGPVIFSRSRERAESLRNALGSGEFGFQFTFLCRTPAPDARLICDLPLARHSRSPRMVVSHTTGKKCQTRFARSHAVGPYACFLADSSYPRRHQILIHAMESGLAVLGDAQYARQRPLMLSSMKRTYTAKRDAEERPLYEGPACYLSLIKLPDGHRLAAPVPPRWNGLVKQLDLHGQG